VSLFHLSYLITLTAYLCSQWTPNVQMKYFMFDWSIYRLLVLNRGWKRDPLQIMIFVYVWFDMRHSWTKNAFRDMNNKKWRKKCKLVSPFLFYNTYGLPVLTTVTKSPNQVFWFSLLDLPTICAKYGLETWFAPNDEYSLMFAWHEACFKKQRLLRRQQQEKTYMV
jgi:hypothetical protein